MTDVAKVADWLADGWDWDQVGAALGLDADEAARRYGHAAEKFARREEDATAGRHAAEDG
jgi:hypothetical protein